ncbi:MAG: Ankyrin repeat domain-containing protein 44 [Piccolia ochrophora]|nr:MAG: Ankyrin repeat domain-containing protein 44 [Piccolia ochrophora]
MAEVLAVASGVAGLLSLTIEVYAVSARYISCVHNVSNTIQDILRELRALKKILTDLDRLIDETDEEEVFKGRSSSLFSTEDAEEYRELLERLLRKLQSQAQGKSLSSKLKTLAWPFSEEKTRRTVDILQKHVATFQSALAIDTFQTTTETLKEVRVLGKEQKEQKISKILEWLSSVDVHQKQTDVSSRRQENAGQWLLKTDLFVQWLERSSPSALWCPGAPGTGKTVMASIVIDHLQRRVAKEGHGIAYFYCDYQDQGHQTASNVLAAIIKQLVIRKPTALEPVEELFDNLHGERKNPTLAQLESALYSVCHHFNQTFLIIDALDECDLAQRKQLFPVFQGLQKASGKLFVTSRPHAQDIARFFAVDAKIPIEASEDDMRRFIEKQIDDDEDLMDLLTDDLRDNIISTIPGRARGVFLIAVLQIRRICDQMTIREVKRALDTMPVGLVEMYEETMARISRQSSKRKELAMRILGWVCHAKRPMSVEELRHALAVDYDPKQSVPPRSLDEENLLRQTMLIDVCAGLVTIEQESKVIRLVHYTAQEYFDGQSSTLFPNAATQAAGTCLTYLLFDEFRSGPCPDSETLGERRQKYEFLDYAAFHWGDHVRGPLETRFMSMILTLLEDDKRSCAVAQIQARCEREFFRWCNMFGDVPEGFEPLQAAASQGLDSVVTLLLERSEDGVQMNHALAESRRGKESMMLRRGDDDVQTDDALITFKRVNGSTLPRESIEDAQRSKDVQKDVHDHQANDVPFDDDVQGIDGVQLANDAPSNETIFKSRRVERNDSTFKTAAHWAAWRGHRSTLQILLDTGIEVHIRSADGFTLLDAACDQGREEAVDLLLERGFDKNNRGFGGHTALLTAAQMGRDVLVQKLLDRGAEWNSPSAFGETPLLMAAANGHIGIVRVLLDLGLDATSANGCGNTPLHCAAFYGHRIVVEQLLQVGAHINATSDTGETPLHKAASQGHNDVVQLLLERDADVHAKSNNEVKSLSPMIGSAGRCVPRKVHLQTCEVGCTPLLLAATHGHDTTIGLLLDKGAVIDARSPDLRTALCMASQGSHEWMGKSHLPAVQLLLQRGAEVDAVDEIGRTPLKLATLNGEKDIMQTLVQHGADIEHKGEFGVRALFIAAAKGGVDATRYLLDEGAQMLAEDERRDTPLHWAAGNGQCETVQLLLDEGVHVDLSLGESGTPLVLAVKGGHEDVVDLLLKRGADAQVRQEIEGNVIHAAAWRGHDAVLQLLIQHGTDLETLDNEGLTPLQCACSEGQVKAVQLLLESGANIHTKSKDGWSAVYIAAEQGVVEVLEILLKHGAAVDGGESGKEGPLDLALRFKREEAAVLLIEHGAPINAKNDDGSPALHIATTYGLELVIRKLLAMGADVAAKDDRSLSALHIATHFRLTSIMELLLDHDMNINITDDDDGWTAIHEAAHQGFVPESRILLSRGASLGIGEAVDGLTVLQRATAEGHEDVVRLLIDGGADIEELNARGLTTLHVAITTSHVNVARYLIAKGASVEATDPCKRTSLMVASIVGDRDMAQLLLDSGANLNAMDCDGSTALHLAVIFQREEVARLLIERGIDLEAKNNRGSTAMFFAVEDGILSLVQALAAKGASLATKMSGGTTPLLLSVIKGQEHISRYLIERGVDLEARTDLDYTALHIATMEGLLDIVKALVDKGADLNAQHPACGTALQISLVEEHPEIARLLIERGADLEAIAPKGNTVLQSAAMRGHLDLVQLMVEKGASVDPRHLDGDNTALHFALLQGHADIARFLVNKGAATHLKNDRGYTALHLSSRDGWHDLVEQILTKDDAADIDARTDGGVPALHFAALEDHTSILELLLSAGADPAATDNEGFTALHCAASEGHDPSVRTLVSHVPAPAIDARTGHGNTPLHLAIADDHLSTATLLLTAGADPDAIPGTRPSKGCPHSHAVVRHHTWAALSLLLAHGAHPDARCGHGSTPLTLAAELGRLDMVRGLLATRKVDVNMRDGDGDTSLLMAAGEGWVEIVRLLLDTGEVDVDSANNKGETPFGRAVERDRGEVVEVLMKWMQERGVMVNGFGKGGGEMKGLELPFRGKRVGA